jgi:hypothetical protein
MRNTEMDAIRSHGTGDQKSVAGELIMSRMGRM